jgi:hypothetical protein
MTLPVPVLDDKTYAQLVDDARKLIPRFAPGWTDQNVHDPGITFIELFAWLVEMQQYRLDQIRDRDYLKFLRLLGIEPQDAAPARADVTFTPINPAGMVPVPKGTPLNAGGIVFETEQPLTVTGARLQSIITFAGPAMTDNTGANGPSGLSYYAFGPDAAAGSRLYLGFDISLAQPGEIIALTFKLVDYPVPVGSFRNEQPDVTPSGTVAWEYYQDLGAGQGAWTSLVPVQDDTLMLSQDGRIYFQTPAHMGQLAIPPYGVWKPDGQHQQGFYWLRATVAESGYELPPKLDRILLNTISAVQRQTLAEASAYSGTGQQQQVFPVSTYLAQSPDSSHFFHLFQTSDQEGYWVDLEILQYEMTPDGLAVAFGTAPPKGSNNIRMISYAQLQGAEYEFWLLGCSNGLPGQSFSLGYTPVRAGTLMIQVQEKDSRWRDWVRVADFDASGPDDPHFTLDPDAGTIVFGDGVNGDLPPAPADGTTENIRLVSYACGGGEQGNVSTGAINSIADSNLVNTLGINNLWPASGGASSEALQAAEIRTRSDLKTPCRAITTEDYEYLTLNTPGLRVARAKALVSSAAPQQVLVKAAGSKPLIWQDWTRVHSFFWSHPGDCHYLFDTCTGAIIFGDGVRGKIPPFRAEIRASVGSLNMWLGQSNGQPGQSFQAAEAPEQVSVAAGSGLSAWQDWTMVASFDQSGPTDCHYLFDAGTGAIIFGDGTAGKMPPFRAEIRARVNYLEMWLGQSNGQPDQNITLPVTLPVRVSVVAVPFSNQSNPVPSPGFRQTVYRHLDRHRLITTEVELPLAPDYVQASISAQVTVKKGFSPTQTQQSVISKLAAFLAPLAPGGPGGEGWPFGRDVYESDIYAVIAQVPGVSCVAGVQIEKNKEIQAYSLVYSGTHNIEIVNSSQ